MMYIFNEFEVVNCACCFLIKKVKFLYYDMMYTVIAPVVNYYRD